MMTTTKISSSELKKLADSYDLPILEALGFDSITPKGIQQKCIIHGGDNPAAFSFDRRRMCWSCFTHGCHKKYGNDIIGLIRAVKNFGYNDCVDWILQIVNNPEINAGYTPEEKVFTSNPPNKILDESILENLEADFSSISDRSFSEKTLFHFQSGVPKNKVKMQHNRLMIPIRNEDGQLVGFTGRSVYEKSDRTGGYHPEWANAEGNFTAIFSKWRHYPKGLNKSGELYNFHEAKRWAERLGFLIVVEGPFDAWRLWEFGVKNCVASFGCSLSKDQFDKIKKHNFKCIALAFDSDLAGKSGFEKADSIFKDRISVEKLILPDNKDPGDLKIEDYNMFIKPQLSVLRRRYEYKDNNHNG